MLFFGTLMDMAHMFSPLHFTFKVVAHCRAAKALCHCDTAEHLAKLESDPSLKVPTIILFRVMQQRAHFHCGFSSHFYLSDHQQMLSRVVDWCHGSKQ